jgi:hypothetical protein
VKCYPYSNNVKIYLCAKSFHDMVTFLFTIGQVVTKGTLPLATLDEHDNLDHKSTSRGT